MDLDEYCKRLPKEKLFNLAISLCEKTLPIWDAYSVNNKLSYRDSVVGLLHEVNTDILSKSISSCRKCPFENTPNKLELQNLLKEFEDPIVALQDLDWELPSAVKLTFYAVYNLLEGIQKPITVFDELTQYVSVNQAVNALEESGLMNFEQIRMIIYS